MSVSAGRVLLMLKGEWSSTVTYTNLDIVHHGTQTWVCKKNCVGVEPSDSQTDYWQGMAKDAMEQVATETANGLMSAADKTKLDNLSEGAEANVQSDWSVTDTSSDAYIKNKPTIDTTISVTSTNAVQNKAVTTELNKKVNAVSGKGLSSNDYTTAEKTKLAGIAEKAEVNVQSDWSVTDTSSDAYIKNKPTIPSAITVDDSISATSTNAVQNRIVFNGDYGVLAKTTTFSGDIITEVDGNGYTRTTTFNADGSITEKIADSAGAEVATKTTVFNADGSISESIS
jgi:hypothetical protein